MIEQNISLKNYNTFGIDVKTESFVAIKSETELVEILQGHEDKPFRVLGGGSNILLTEDYKGLTLVMKNKGISIKDETETNVIIEVKAGENWHQLVLWSLDNEFGGIEKAIESAANHR